MKYINESRDEDFCKKVPAVASVIYRPVTLKELKVYVEALDYDNDDDDQNLKDIIGSCGCFLTIREGVLSFVHQSAKDFLLDKVFDEILPSGVAHQHHAIFSRSLETLSTTLRRGIYSLHAPGFSINQVSPPDPDPLASSQYSFIYSVDHLSDSHHRERIRDNKDLQDGSVVHGRLYAFLQKHLLHWLEALSLMHKTSDGIRAIISLNATISAEEYPDLHKFIYDAKRVVLHYRLGIEEAPLQVYYSALIFTPESSTIRRQFEDQAPRWIRKMTKVQTNWSALQQTLEGHTDRVLVAASPPDGRQLASASDGETVSLWDAATGALQQTLEGYTGSVKAVAFSPDGKQLASASWDHTVRLWDSTTGAPCGMLQIHVAVQELHFSSDGQALDTDRGRLDIRTFSLDDTSFASAPGGGTFVDGPWVVQGMQRILWLPPDYRATCAAVHNYVLAMGHASGRVSILGIGIPCR